MLSARAHNLAEYVGIGRQQAHVNYYSTTALISVDALQDVDAADAAHGVPQAITRGATNRASNRTCPPSSYELRSVLCML